MILFLYQNGMCAYNTTTHKHLVKLSPKGQELVSEFLDVYDSFER